MSFVGRKSGRRLLTGAGKNHSWEPYAKGMTHAFILEFDSKEDRDYYLLKDPVHRAFSEKAGPFIEDSLVVGKRCACSSLTR
jgi:hypothetical protein